MLIIILALVIGVPILIILTSVFIIVVIYCCCQNNGTVEDELPKSLIENCRRAKPPPEEQGKYLPELFDASAFQFKGPLIIKCPKLHILEHDLTNAKSVGNNTKDHVRFDENLNVAYNIGENVEIIIKSYGDEYYVLNGKQTQTDVELLKREMTIGSKIGSGEMIKENETDEGDEMNEQENDSIKSFIEKREKEIAVQSKRQNSQSKKKKSETSEVPDPKMKSIKSQQTSVRTQITQSSRYSESSTQTPRISGEAIIKSPKTQSSGTDIANKREGNFSIKYEVGERKNKPQLKRASNIPFEQTTHASTRSRMLILMKEQHGVPSIEAKNITPTMQTVKSHHWVAEEINPSTSGSSGS